MKVILDANIYLSYLLAPRTHRTITSVVDACFIRADILIVVPQELIGEIERTVREKRYLRSRSDDYLLAYAIEDDVDFLVTGDPDLLVLGGIDGLRIMKPSEFHDELEKHPRSRSKN